MSIHTRPLSACLFVIAVAAMPAGASYDSTSYRSASSQLQMSGTSPELAGRPGELYFQKAARAYAKKDYAFAVDMYRVAASWAFKPAQYNLGLMYVQGDGVAVDRARGLAWLALAAERGDPDYAHARDVAYSEMDEQAFERANVVWRELRGTYGDEVALRRARSRWQLVRTSATGSHLGAMAGPVLVGGMGRRGRNTRQDGSVSGESQTGWGITGPGAIDGSIAYRQLRASPDPYDVRFKPVETGTVAVGDVIPVGDAVRRTSTRPGHD